jgi:hypothetical protein
MPEELDVAPGEDIAWKPPGSSAPESPPGPQEAAKRRVLGLTGGVITSQDGQVVRYRKKCLKCGYMDTNVATALIRYGTARADFYCPKCRKSQPVRIEGTG